MGFANPLPSGWLSPGTTVRCTGFPRKQPFKHINPYFYWVKPVLRGLGVLWKVFFLLNFTFSLTILYPLFALFLSRENWFRYCFRLMRLWGRYLIFSNGIGYNSRWEGDLPEPPYIICPNHSSYLDIPLTYALFPHYFVFMGKQELEKVPLFNIFFKRMNILVDRKSKTGAARSLQEASAEADKGHCLAIFPEGTISRQAPRLIPFKNGPFKLAVEKNIPIVPVTYINGWNLLQDSAFLKARSGPGILRVIVHPPIFPAGNTDRDLVTLKQKVFEAIETPLKRYYGD